MSTRQPPSPQPTPFRMDDDRRRDEAKIVALQNQVDELRQAIRELTSRQARNEEQFKIYEGVGAQNKLSLEQIRQESHQSAHARALDENRTRQQLTDLEARVDDAIRPIRSLQAHVSELLEQSRKKTDDTGQHQKRYDELRAQIEHLSAHGDRTLVITHQLRDSIDILRGETDGLRRDILRTEDAIKIVDQESRRRVAEVAQAVENFSARIDELRSDLAHLFDLIEDTRRSIVHVDPSLEELRGVDAILRQDLTRFASQTNERHELMLERAEDVRQETDARFADQRQANEQRFERLVERIEGVGEVDRELSFRISALQQQIEELRQIDGSLRRDLWHLHEQRVRFRYEQAQQELELVASQRREAEGDGAKEPRPARRPPDI